MKKIATVVLILLAFPAVAQEAMSPLQQYLYNESGYAPPPQSAQPQPQPQAVVAANPAPYPPAVPQPLNGLQQYLYNESGYAPPQPAPAQQPEAVAVNSYYPPQPEYDAPDGYYEDEGSDVGPSGSNGDASLRGMLTSSGF